MKKISIKREQSQAGLSFAEREKFRPQVKNKLLLLLALLLTAATGAWAQTETPLLTIESTDYMSFRSGSMTFDDKVTITFSNPVTNTGNTRGWYANPTETLLTVTGTNGYTITSCKFYAETGAAMNGYTVEGESPSVYLYSKKVFTDDSKSVEIGQRGIMKIEVFGTAASSSAPKHLIKATYRERTRSLEQPLPYATTIGELFEAVTGEPFSDLISTMSSMEMPLTGISSNNTSAVSIGELNGASTPVTVIADGKATISINFGSYAYGIFVSAISPLYAKMKDGVKDADKWTVKVGDGQAQALPIGGLKGDGSETVTLKYTGRLKVKGVTATSDEKPAAPTGKTVDLSTLTAGYEAKDGETLTGTLASNVKISIAAGATVTLKDVNITNLGVGYDWAGITCESDATLVLEGTNTVCAGRGSDGYNNYPGIYIAPDKTLTIQGDGTLTAYSNDSQPYGAGIGGGYKIACGNIVINSGTITATGGWNAAGIGGGNSASCGNITINGGTVTATGGNYGAGIGSGAAGENQGSCGNITISGGTVTATGGENAAGIGGGSTNGVCGTITITKGVTSVKATKGANTPNSIGAGDGGQDITVNIEAGANVTQN